MCLDTIQSREPTVTQGKGYKVMRPCPSSDQMFYRTIYRATYQVWSIGQWHEAPDHGWITLAAGWQSYEMGFHIFTRLSDAKLYRFEVGWPDAVVCEVAYNDARTIGTQLIGDSNRSAEVIVAKQCCILREVEASDAV